MKDKQEAIARIIQGDLPTGDRPYAQIAELTGLTEAEVIAIIQDMLNSGVIRRLGAVLRHQAAGVTDNAMVVWAVPQERHEAVGAALSCFREVSHCYMRTPAFAGRYSLFTMVHAPREGLPSLLARLQQAAGTTDCLVLATVEEFKKESMVYFR